jgi:cyclopropane-fatty-acyl-phospholipid synthase
MKEPSSSACATSSDNMPSVSPTAQTGAQPDSASLLEALERLFQAFDGRLAVRLWDGRTLVLGRGPPTAAPARFTLVCHTPNVIRSLLGGGDPLRLADAYFRGDLDIEGDFFAALALKDHVKVLRLPWRDRWRVLLTTLRVRSAAAFDEARASLLAPPVQAHSKAENREAIGFHYDVSNDFYRLWLDERMVYSCAYFEHPGMTLEDAQRAKLEHICRKLQLAPGERLLDVGCGWGALVIHAAQHHGVTAHGITLSKRQWQEAGDRIRAAGLSDRVTVELRDYRDLPREPGYDKVSSIGMFEHVGLKNLPVYFETLYRQLKPGGLLLNHGITHYVEGWDKTVSTEFINRYVFPDGQLDTVGNIQRHMERADFELLDVEAWRPHYAKTLRHWVARLEATHARALAHVSEATWRVWRLYMAACALEFESGDIGVYQLLAARRIPGGTPIPMTRAHMYPG